MAHPKVSNIDWDIGNAPEAPSAPDTLQQTGLTLGFLSDMILRTLYTRGGMLGLDLAKFLCLPFKVIEESLGFLKNEKAIEVLNQEVAAWRKTRPAVIGGAGVSNPGTSPMK